MKIQRLTPGASATVLQCDVPGEADFVEESGGVTLSAHAGDEREAIVAGAEPVTPEVAIRMKGPDAENILIVNNHTNHTCNSGIGIRGVSGDPLCVDPPTGCIGASS